MTFIPLIFIKITFILIEFYNLHLYKNLPDKKRNQLTYIRHPL